MPPIRGQNQFLAPRNCKAMIRRITPMPTKAPARSRVNRVEAASGVGDDAEAGQRTYRTAMSPCQQRYSPSRGI